MSILLFYNRLFGVRNAFRYSVFALMAATWAWGIAVFFATLFQCKPIAGNWDKTIPGSHCLLDHILLKLSIPNAVLDWFVLFLPIVVVWNLQISIDRKVALSAIFLVGAFACAASILRCWAIANIDHVDSTWSYTRYLLWTQVELSVGIICACLPTLQPVLNATLGPCFGRVFATFHSTKKASAATDGSGPSSSSKWHASSSNKGSRNQMSGRGISTVASNNGDWNRLADGTAGLAPTNNTVTTAWTVDEGDEQSDDAIPLKGIRVQQDLEQNMQRGLRPGMAL
ncbi:hypothetical protein HO133_001873 [Letharia lupina]|uniref:Rhodopsin domain-containing protein n=1 Tax=Letharia lupina TaxID=560253 RepID=A0A8H6CEH4_9LECA|nr:uncharacterized protein HO133_001873 [Letharia lupina]KAF6221905.1 hypothetical protein HO133_001873 [Letharia lupina]